MFGFLSLSLGVLYIVWILIPNSSSVLETFLTPVFNIDRSELLDKVGVVQKFQGDLEFLIDTSRSDEELVVTRSQGAFYFGG